MLSTSNATRKLLNKMSATEQQSFIDKVKETFENLMQWVNDLLAHYNSNSEEAKVLREYKDMLKKVSKQWDEMLVQAIERNQGLEKSGESKVENSAKDEVLFSEREIIGISGKSYGIGVYLDSNLLTGLTDAERKEMIKEFVVTELAGKHFIVYDNNVAVDIGIAKKNDTIKKRNGKKRKVIEELYRKNIDKTIKQEAVVLADELIKNAEFKNQLPSIYQHGWLDNNGKNDWDYWKAYIQEKNKSVWEATLNIANTANGEKILYDIDPIKMVEGPVKSGPTTTDPIILNSDRNVKENFADIDTTGRELSE